MAQLQIITYPNPILQKKTTKIKDAKSPEIKELILDMLETLEQNSGVGLAAPQVGKSLKLCVIKLAGRTHILINPEIKSKSWRKTIEEEGCLSFPGQFIPVKRSSTVKVKAENRAGKAVTLSAEGLFSRALQHEIDHLNGILFIDRKAKKARKK
ncbi:MAG: peptide deformylase [Parcubacteria group bacterium]|jgi:peptide deformylase